MTTRHIRFAIALGLLSSFVGASQASAQVAASTTKTTQPPTKPSTYGAAPTAPGNAAAASSCGTNHFGSAYYAEYDGYSTSYYYATCSSLTINSVYYRDFYKGYYYSYNQSKWIEGSRGYLYISPFDHDVVLLSDVVTGTAEKVHALNMDTGISWSN